MHHYDTIIIGGGHNGLVCSAYLAKKGHHVLVLEASDNLGGLAETREFHPGFKASVAHSISNFSTKVAKDLNLSAYGFTSGAAPMTTVGLNASGEHVTLTGLEVEGVGVEDVESYKEYRQVMQKFTNLLHPFWHKTMPRIGDNSLPSRMTFGQLGLKLRLLGKEDMGEFMRIATLPARDLMDENFDSDLLKAVLCWDGLIGSKMAPRSPNATVLSLLYRMTGEHGGAHIIPAEGIESLFIALKETAERAGAEIRTGTRVSRILIQADESGLKTNGVKLASGETITANRVVSTTDPKRTFLELVGIENLEIEFTNRIRRLRSEGYVAKLHLALNGVPKFTGLDKPDGRLIIAPNMDAIEFAFDDAKYGECSKQPVMEVVIPSLHNESLAPVGQHVLSAHVMYVPYELKSSWTDQTRAVLQEKIIDTLSIYAPDIKEHILYSEVLTPLDLEQRHGATGGHWHHTELSLDQMFMMRPTYEAAQYATPIPGLYVCGAGCHPGGGLVGASGHNAAHEMLK
ncbi:MAG: phytoene dehydrogenase [Gammaproteobacteria bacterium]|nr:phytoene dehydrogenase [Gammaproteobacteria bacterium]HAC88385.1 NAD(P)/FAD-dependent oxidoreductase [Gammaproteobacteria bacterium]